MRCVEDSPTICNPQVSTDDREQCRTLWRELTEWHRHIYGDPTIGGDQPEDQFDNHLAEVGPQRLWVATCNAHVVGLVGLIKRNQEAEMEPLIVSEAHRRQGLGAQLTRTVISIARTLNVRMLSVRPVARNVQAIQFFHEQGFVTLGHIELFLDFSKSRWNLGPQLFDCEFTI